MKEKLGLLPLFCRKTKCEAVPDPWYIGTEEAFNNVLDSCIQEASLRLMGGIMDGEFFSPRLFQK
eukprot:6485426-Amphidinium_carterae.1